MTVSKAAFGLTMAGIPLVGEGPAAIESIEVSTSLVRPGSAVITFADPLRGLMRELRLRLGTSMEVSASSDVGRTVLIDGDIVGVEADIGHGGTKTIVVLHDPLHRLQRSVESHTYRDRTVADIVRQVADRNHLSVGDIDDRGYPILAVTNQFHETDFDFLSYLASEVGVSLFWHDGKLQFTSPSSASDGPGSGLLSGDDPLLIVRDDDLIRGHVSLSTVGATPDSTAVGWDMMANEALSSVYSISSLLVEPGESATDVAQAAFGGSLGASPSTTALSASQRFSTTQESLEHAALVHSERVGDRTAELELVVEGRPALHAGQAISVVGLDDPFDGSYSITEAIHRYEPQMGYTTELHITGLADRSLGAFTSRRQRSDQLMSGVVPGVVSANRDEEAGAYRIKVRFPWLGEDVETDWLQVTAAGAGAGRGIAFLPEVGDGVLVAFQAGNPRQPVVVGTTYNGQDKPPTELDDQVAGNGEVIRRSIVSRLGHKVVFVDAAGEEAIELVSADGGCHVILDQAGRKIEIVSAGDLSLEANGTIEIGAGGDLKLSARGSAELSAAAATKIAGARIDLN